MFGQTLLWQNHSPALTWPAASSASGCSGCPPTKHTYAFFFLKDSNGESTAFGLITDERAAVNIDACTSRHKTHSETPVSCSKNAAAQETAPARPGDNGQPRRISWNLGKLWRTCGDAEPDQHRVCAGADVTHGEASHLGQLTEGVQDVLLDLQLVLHQL